MRSTQSTDLMTDAHPPGYGSRRQPRAFSAADTVLLADRSRSANDDRTRPSQAAVSAAPILCGHPLTGVGRFPNLAGGPAGPATRDPPVLPTCITMHRRSPAKL